MATGRLAQMSTAEFTREALKNGVSPDDLSSSDGISVETESHNWQPPVGRVVKRKPQTKKVSRHRVVQSRINGPRR